MYKYAVELKPNDLFAMAGLHYKLLETYPTDNDEMLVLAFCAVDGNTRFKMTIANNTLFTILN